MNIPEMLTVADELDADSLHIWAARLRAAVPAGWQMVPVELTPEIGRAMYAAWDAAGFDPVMGPAEAVAMYRAILAAVPPMDKAEGVKWNVYEPTALHLPEPRDEREGVKARETFILSHGGTEPSCPFCARYMHSGHSEICVFTRLQAPEPLAPEAGEVVAWRCTKPALATVIVRSEDRAEEWREHGYTCEPLFLHPSPAALRVAGELESWADAARRIPTKRLRALAAELRGGK